MKKMLIVIVLIFVFPILSSAEDSNKKEAVFETCFVVADFAEAAMTARQVGVSLDKLVKSLDRDSVAFDGSLEILKKAYSQQRYMTPLVRERVIREFRNQIFLICIQNF